MAYQKGVSGNPTGRPKGTPNKTTSMIRAACPEILEAVIEQAKAGDLQAAALILSRGIPTLKASHEPVQILTTSQLEFMSPSQRADAINNAALTGRVSADVAANLLDGITKGCAILESTDLAERVTELEQKAAQRGERR
ncbi:DUF5681 domain-containing protein [Aeromonas media]|uniref:DUF5681 domain-containing protein n=1 Tax=Aeromonas media TaxID=651 RepID=UPI003D1A25CD